MLSAYSIGQMEKALQQPPVMAALIDAQDRVRMCMRLLHSCSLGC